MKIKLGGTILMSQGADFNLARVEKVGTKFFYVQYTTGGPLVKFRFTSYTSECGQFKFKFFEGKK